MGDLSMLKRWRTAIRKWVFADRITTDSRPVQDGEISAARRGFFKRAAVGAVSITGTAGMAKVVVDSVPQPDRRERYIQDGLAGEQELKHREYVLMSDQEKSDMVQSFIDNYPNQG